MGRGAFVSRMLVVLPLVCSVADGIQFAVGGIQPLSPVSQQQGGLGEGMNVPGSGTWASKLGSRVSPGKGGDGGGGGGSVGLQGGGSDLESMVDQLLVEKRELEAEVMRLRSENTALLDVRSGQQKTLDPFLFRKHPEPLVAAEAAAAGVDDNLRADGSSFPRSPGMPPSSQASAPGKHSNLVDAETIDHLMSLKGTSKRKQPEGPTARSGAYRRPLTPLQAKQVEERVLRRVERKMAEGIDLSSSTAGKSSKKNALRASVGVGEETASEPVSDIHDVEGRGSAVSAKGGEPSPVKGGSSGRGSEAFIGQDKQAAGLDAEVAKALSKGKKSLRVKGGDHHWEGQIKLSCDDHDVNIASDVGVRMHGAWCLEGHGGLISSSELHHEYGTCVCVEGGQWTFGGSSIMSAGLAALHDTVEHNKINTALFCAGAAAAVVDDCLVGGLGQGKEAFWGVFSSAESRVTLVNSTVEHCKDSGVAAVASSVVEMKDCVVECCAVGVTGDEHANVTVDSCMLRKNDAAFECGPAGVPNTRMALLRNTILGKGTSQRKIMNLAPSLACAQQLLGFAVLFARVPRPADLHITFCPSLSYLGTASCM